MAKVIEGTDKFIYEGVLNKNPEVLIDWFDELGSNNHKYSFLSNFHEGDPFELWGIKWATAEHAYAASKVFDVNEEVFNAIVNSTDPQEAKTLGRTANPIRKDWDEIKYDIMKQVVRAKFLKCHNLTAALLNTGDAYLQEGTFWHDAVWGVELTYVQPDGGLDIEPDPVERYGKNWLGTILMETRAFIRLGIATSTLTQ